MCLLLVWYQNDHRAPFFTLALCFIIFISILPLRRLVQTKAVSARDEAMLSGQECALAVRALLDFATLVSFLLDCHLFSSPSFSNPGLIYHHLPPSFLSLTAWSLSTACAAS